MTEHREEVRNTANTDTHPLACRLHAAGHHYALNPLRSRLPSTGPFLRYTLRLGLWVRTRAKVRTGTGAGARARTGGRTRARD